MGTTFGEEIDEHCQRDSGRGCPESLNRLSQGMKNGDRTGSMAVIQANGVSKSSLGKCCHAVVRTDFRIFSGGRPTGGD